MKLKMPNSSSVIRAVLISTIVSTIPVSISTIPTNADYVVGTANALAKLQNANTNNPDVVKRIAVVAKTTTPITADTPIAPAQQTGKVKISSPIVVTKPNPENITVIPITDTTDKNSKPTSTSQTVDIKDELTGQENEKNEENEENEKNNKKNVVADTFSPSEPPVKMIKDSNNSVSIESKNSDKTKSNTTSTSTDASTLTSTITSNATTSSDNTSDTSISSSSVNTTQNDEENVEISDIDDVVKTTTDDKETNKKILSINLISDETTVWNGDTFNPDSGIISVSSDDGKLPVLSIDGDVDTSKDGKYTIHYKVVDSLGKSVEKDMTVYVKTPDEVIQNRIEEAKRKAEEERKALEEEQKKQALQQALQRAAVAKANLNIGAPAVDRVGASLNPYPLSDGYWTNCTWGAWQLVYQKEGVRLPKWGNASEWFYNAIADGYSVDSNPRAGDVAVYADNGFGHVAYVSEVSPDGNSVYVQQGSWSGSYSEYWNPRYESSGGQALLGYIHIRK